MTTKRDNLTLFLADPCAHNWAKDGARVALTKDPVDAANYLGVLARMFDERAMTIAEELAAA